MPEPHRNISRISFVGFGEVGRRFSRDFMATGGIGLAAYDIALADPVRRGGFEEAARVLSVALRENAAAACEGADVVISAVTADQTEVAAAEAARHLRPGQVFLDVNSASPMTKIRAAALVEASGAAYVEGAVMAAVLAPGIKVPILAGGPAAAETAAGLNRLGMNLTAAAGVHGRASAIKLCRSIMIKGLEALIGDCAQASRHFGVEREVYDSLAATFPSIDWPALALGMGERVAKHGRRRAAEMREAADMLAEIDIDPALARAVADAHQRGARG